MPYLEIGENISIRYRKIEGAIDAPYLVFLHEGLGCIEMWKDFPQRLCKKTGFPGLLYDRCGYGKSSPSTKKRDIHYLHEQALVELPAVLQGVIPGKPHILIGHSDGATIALIHASEPPALLKGVIAEAAHVFVERVTLAGVEQAEKNYNLNGAGRLMKYHGEKTDAVLKAWSETWLAEWFRNWNIEKLLPRIVCPLMVLQGREDQYGTEAQVEAIISQVSGPVFSSMPEGCGHAPHLEKPELVIEIMAGFVGNRG